MKIKRYMAASMRAALAAVRAEQGPDAVILSSRRVEEGIEVIAAVDYDEALFVDATLKRVPTLHEEAVPQPQPSAASGTAPRAAQQPCSTEPAIAPATAVAAGPATAAEPSNVFDQLFGNFGPSDVFRLVLPTALDDEPSPEPVPMQAMPMQAVAVQAAPLAAPRSDDGYSEMQRELKHLRELMQGELAHRSWHDKRLRNPLQALVLEQLSAMDIAPDVAMELAAQTPAQSSLKDPAHIPLALLARHLRVVDNLSTVNGGVIALVGPTGAGKTTTIAKLAARWSMQHGSRDLALVSTDGYRIGAREQLMTYARILGATMHSANSGAELARVLDGLKDKKLVLIDTAGMGTKDVRLSEQLAALQLGAAHARVMLTLPANGDAHALEEIVRTFSMVSPAACILTKVDEAASLGGVICTTLRHKLKIAYLCNGQRVPEDLHSAHERRVWLVRAAHKLKEGAPTPVNENYLARNFGAQIHA